MSLSFPFQLGTECVTPLRLYPYFGDSSLKMVHCNRIFEIKDPASFTEKIPNSFLFPLSYIEWQAEIMIN